MFEYSSVKEAISKFELTRKYRKPNRKITILEDSHTEFIFICHDGIPPDIAIYGSFFDIEKQIKTVVTMEVDLNREINDNDIEKAKERFQAFAKCAHKITGWKNVPVLSEAEEEDTLRLERYPPYYKPGKNDPRRAGDLVATLIDKKTSKPIPDKIVVFYVEKDEEEKGEKLCKVTRKKILSDTYYEPFSVVSLPNVDGIRCLLRFDKNKFLWLCSTDNKGKARTNYLYSLDLELFSEELKRGENGKITGTIKVVVLTLENLENKQESLEDREWKIDCEKSVDIEISSIAKIMKISGDGVPDDPPIARQGVFSGPGQVRVFRKLNHSKFGLDTPQKEGFELMPADIINIDGDTSIEIVWINGDRGIVMVPKTAGTNRNFTLASTAYDSGIHTGYEKTLSAIYSVTIEKGCNMFLDTVKGRTIGETGGKILDFVVDVIKKIGEDDNEATRIILKSKVIIDSAGDEIRVYNIEGSPDIKTVKGEEVTLADKEMVAIAENGSLSEVQSFDPEEVLNEFFDTLNGSITIKAETASTIERETVKLTVIGVAGDPIRVESSPLSDKVLFKDGIDDTPTGANYHVNWFTDTIDADGIRRYAVEFNDMGIYTIKVSVTGGDREGDSDTADITVLEKEVPLDLHVPIPPELKISKLYVGKPVYSRGTEVDVHYDVKNIGTGDIDEYHVECRINDLKGNEVYKFVGSTHSIASGEQQKFIAAENWKIPSDARIGPYIINCALIWGSKRDTAGSEFFVTHPAKREDRTAELKISNLYTGKSEYLKGAGERVDVCYFVKNTGTVDISEYHVIYQIFDSEGKRYCWFISDMFGSIVAGKEDKWQSGVWKLPSDAKVGRYTVDAMVIWGLDRFSRETVYFFVK